MAKPDYKKAYEDLLKILGSTQESEDYSINNGIIDVTDDSIGTVYQFTENDLLVIKDSRKEDNSN